MEIMWMLLPLNPSMPPGSSVEGREGHRESLDVGVHEILHQLEQFLCETSADGSILVMEGLHVGISSGCKDTNQL